MLKTLTISSPILFYYAYSSNGNFMPELIQSMRFFKRSKNVQIDWNQMNPLNQHLSMSSLVDVANAYNPPMLMKIPLLSLIWGLTTKANYQLDYQRHYIKCDQKGNFSLDFAFPILQPALFQKKKVLMVIPGVTGSSNEEYIKEMCGYANTQGYVTVVLNIFYSKDQEENQRILDPSNSLYIKESVDLIQQQLGSDIELYGVGFSLGANHLLRYLGADETYKTVPLRAAVSVSNPFDVIATTIYLRKTCFGIYDKSINQGLIRPFLQKKFKIDPEYQTEEFLTKLKGMKSLYDSDNILRTKILGRNSINHLYRDVSCDRFIPNISIPFMVLHSKDDPICPVRNIPMSDILRNPNSFVIQTNNGGHCDFFTKQENGQFFKYKRHYPEMVIKYFDEVDNFMSRKILI